MPSTTTTWSPYIPVAASQASTVAGSFVGYTPSESPAAYPTPNSEMSKPNWRTSFRAPDELSRTLVHNGATTGFVRVNGAAVAAGVDDTERPSTVATLSTQRLMGSSSYASHSTRSSSRAAPSAANRVSTDLAWPQKAS